MPRGLNEELITLLGLLLLFIIPAIMRLIAAARRRRQGLGLGAGAPGPESPLPDEAPGEKLPSGWPPALAPAQPALGIQPLAQQGPPLAQPDQHSTKRLPGRLQGLSPWQQAVVWAEVLGPPRGLDGEPPLS